MSVTGVRIYSAMARTKGRVMGFLFGREPGYVLGMGPGGEMVNDAAHKIEQAKGLVQRGKIKDALTFLGIVITG